ncbi:hypothetical protein BIZ78_gp146 [Erwinia phage vB_EamM_Caitlin]|uniref:hypothetical protein n=1 Tax=Erwinia phage vB_EamM_Caitlin TaxID=1883379 RepID=UPI00081CC95D|nr:hypothetical protein BIZ78_gp146 [Erwinia phage vB_EamM_Caitlin]ANZ48429.1 hypothetical protein CAITLIN_134 [Erwinia phage vB_EamM_Caitlin]
MNKEPLIIVPLFEENIPVRDPTVQTMLCMLRKAYTLAYRKRHRITIGLIPATPQAVSFVCDLGLYGYLALSKLKKDTPEALEIIQMLSDMYKEFTTGEKKTYRHTDMMYKLACEDEGFGLRRSLIMQKPSPTPMLYHLEENVGEKVQNDGFCGQQNLGDIYLTTTNNLPEAMKRELAEVLCRWNIGRNHVFDQADMDIIPSAASVIVDWEGNGVYRVTLHAVGGDVSDLALRMIKARLLGKSDRGCSYHIEGKGQMFVEIDSMKNPSNAQPTIIEMVRLGIQNNVVHTVLDICAKRYECEIVLKPRKK